MIKSIASSISITIENLPSLIQRLFWHIKPLQQRGPLAEHRDPSAAQSTQLRSIHD